MSARPSPSSSDRPRPQSADRPEGRPVLPDTTRDETGEGWGEQPDPRDSDEERFLRERPPHHEG